MTESSKPPKPPQLVPGQPLWRPPTISQPAASAEDSQAQQSQPEQTSPTSVRIPLSSTTYSSTRAFHDPGRQSAPPGQGGWGHPGQPGHRPSQPTPAHPAAAQVWSSPGTTYGAGSGTVRSDSTESTSGTGEDSRPEASTRPRRGSWFLIALVCFLLGGVAGFLLAELT